jgi:hypothetical protein
VIYAAREWVANKSRIEEAKVQKAAEAAAAKEAAAAAETADGQASTANGETLEAAAVEPESPGEDTSHDAEVKPES